MVEKSHLNKVIVCMITIMVGITMVISSLGVGDVSAASKPAKVTGVYAKFDSYSSIKVSWKESKGASSYEIWRSTSRNGSYKEVKTASKLYCSDTKLDRGKVYYYKVRGINGKTKGSFSDVRSATIPLYPPSVSLVEKGKTSLNIKVYSKDAEWYDVVRVRSDGKQYKSWKVNAVKGKSVTFKDSGLTAGKTYKYIVTAKKSYNGGWVKSIDVRKSFTTKK